MIDYTEFYPDELLYSYLSRHYVRSGFVTYRDMADYLYSRKGIRPEIRFANPLREEVRLQISDIKPWEEIAVRHTMLPQYRFIDSEKIKNAYRLVCEGKTILNYTRNTKDNNRVLYYCPECAKEDRERYGETYWHRHHQIDGLHLCGKHWCFLEETSVPVTSRAAPTFSPAEIVLPEQAETFFCNNQEALKFAKYCHKVFDGELYMGEYSPAGDLLSYSINRQYISESGGSRKMDAFVQDLTAFIGNMEVDREVSEVAVQKVFTGKNHNFLDICMIAYFEGIPAELLTTPSVWEEHIPKNSIYMELAQKTGVEYGKVKTIGDEVIRRYRTGRRVLRPSGRKDIQWAELDISLLDSVKEACRAVYGYSDRRPGKVTVKRIQRMLNLPERQLERLPHCMDEIKKWQESQPQYWAREVVWAVHTLLNNNRDVNWKQVRELTNLRKEDFYRCKENINSYTDDRESEFIRNLI